MKKLSLLFIIMLISLMSPQAVLGSDTSSVQPSLSACTLDSDGDGLSDFQEKYKYLTDSQKADSDGDGISDGGWDERREYTYTIKARMQLAGPWDINSMNNDYQDTRIVEVKKGYLECEIVFYTENNIKESISSNKNWGNYGPEFDKYLKSYIHANWDEQMRKDLIKELKAYGIDPEKLSDKELVQKVSLWIEDTTKIVEHRSPPQFYLRPDKNGHLFVDEKYRRGFESSSKLGKNITDEEIINTQVLGKQMYYNKTRGGCTSSATYAATIYRALGIPTRIIHSIRFTEGVLKFTPNINNPIVREILIETSKMKGGHQLPEVYIDGQWVRMDYEEFGSDNIHQGRGLHYQNLTMNDYSDIDMVASYVEIMAEDPFNNKDFYNLLDLSDSYGKYYKVNHRYGIDPSSYDGYFIFGEKSFSAIVRPTVLTELKRFKRFESQYGNSGSINQFKEEYLNDNNLIILSANTEYGRLPSAVRTQISRDEYMSLAIDDFKTIKVNKAIVLIIKK